MLVLQMVSVLTCHFHAPSFQQPETQGGKQQAMNTAKQDDNEPEGGNNLIVCTIDVEVGCESIAECMERWSRYVFGGIELLPWSAFFPSLSRI